MLLYVKVFQLNISEFFVYRLNFILWRLRNFITLGIKYFLWLAVFESSQIAFGYTESQMLTYILLSNVIANISMSTKTDGIAGEILKGDIINYILRPFSFFSYHIARDTADKFINISFSIVEALIFILLLRPTLFIQSEPFVYAQTAIFIILGCIIAFYVNMCLSFIAFWSNEVWAPRFIFWMLVLVFAGAFFPLDILPRTLYYAFFFTPFPYLYYLPSRIYLGIPQQEVIALFFMAMLWAGGMYFIATKIWAKGMKEFSFFGR